MRWRPSALAPTHFGVYHDVDQHLGELTECLERFQHWAEAHGAGAFTELLRRDLTARSDPDTARVYGQAMPPEQTFAGLERYLQRRNQGS